MGRVSSSIADSRTLPPERNLNSPEVMADYLNRIESSSRQLLDMIDKVSDAVDAAEGGVPLPGEGLKNLLEKVLADADARIPDR